MKAKRIDPRLDLVQITAWQLVIGSLPLLALSSIAERGAAVRWDPQFLALLGFLALAGTAPSPSAD